MLFAGRWRSITACGDKITWYFFSLFSVAPFSPLARFPPTWKLTTADCCREMAYFRRPQSWQLTETNWRSSLVFLQTVRIFAYPLVLGSCLATDRHFFIVRKDLVLAIQKTWWWPSLGSTWPSWRRTLQVHPLSLILRTSWPSHPWPTLGGSCGRACGPTSLNSTCPCQSPSKTVIRVGGWCSGKKATRASGVRMVCFEVFLMPCAVRFSIKWIGTGAPVVLLCLLMCWSPSWGVCGYWSPVATVWTARATRLSVAVARVATNKRTSVPLPLPCWDKGTKLKNDVPFHPSWSRKFHHQIKFVVFPTRVK